MPCEGFGGVTVLGARLCLVTVSECRGLGCTLGVSHSPRPLALSNPPFCLWVPFHFLRPVGTPAPPPALPGPDKEVGGMVEP